MDCEAKKYCEAKKKAQKSTENGCDLDHHIDRGGLCICVFTLSARYASRPVLFRRTGVR